jgi:nitrate reductase beta subunit
MVWYVPPLSPVMSMIEGDGSEADPDDVFPAIDDLRIPIAYLANLLTAGNEAPVRLALKRLAAMRTIMRERNLGAEPDPAAAEAVGLDLAELDHLYRLLAIAHSHERYVIPQGHSEVAGPLVAKQGGGGFPQPLDDPPAPRGTTAFVPLSSVKRLGS